jgi:hypothetical protein
VWQHGLRDLREEHAAAVGRVLAVGGIAAAQLPQQKRQQHLGECRTAGAQLLADFRNAAYFDLGGGWRYIRGKCGS